MRWNSINYNFKLLSLGWLDGWIISLYVIHHSLYICPHILYTFNSISIYRNSKTTSDNICFHKLIHHLINFVAMNKQIWNKQKPIKLQRSRQNDCLLCWRTVHPNESNESAKWMGQKGKGYKSRHKYIFTGIQSIISL